MLVLFALVGLAAIWDAVQRRIPNPLVLTGLVAGGALKTQASGLPGLGSSLLGAGVALALLIVPFALRRMGGGDVKISMVCGAFLAWNGAVHVVLIATLIHGLVAALFLIGKRRLPAIRGWTPDYERVPFAVALAAAVALYSLDIVRFF